MLIIIVVVAIQTCESNPIICKDIEEVLPEQTSCLCLKTFNRAHPLPLSNSPLVKTPSNVDFPTSELPKTAILNSMLYWSSGT